MFPAAAVAAAAAASERCYSGASAALEDHAAGFRSLTFKQPREIRVPFTVAASKNSWGFLLVVNNSKSKRIAAAPWRCARLDVDVVSSRVQEADRDDRHGDGGSGNDDDGRGGGDGGDGGHGDEDGDHEENVSSEEEFGSLLSAEEIEKQVKARGAALPADMAEAARTVGLRELILTRYLDLQASPWPLGPAIRNSPLLRNRMLADPSFLFKVLTEVAIDSGCATFAEVNKRGNDFWNEFELYLSDLLVGVVMDVALVSMLAPFVQFGGGVSAGRSRISRTLQALPSSIFEAERPGRKFSAQQRLGTFFYKAIQYGAVGFICGLIGQGFASTVMVMKRKFSKSLHPEVPIPPLLKSAALWAVFMGVSSNTRYQVINGLERVVEGSPLGKTVPLVAMAFTVGVRFANNIYGGMQFVDWARLSGVQ